MSGFGRKMQKKSWDSSEMDPKVEERKIIIMLAGVILFMILMAIFMGWITHSLHR